MLVSLGSQEVRLVVFFLAYFVVAFAWRSWRHYRLTGINPIVLPSGDDAYSYVARGFKLVLVAIPAYLMFAAFAGSVGDLPHEQSTVAKSIGWILLVGSLCLTAIAQGQMGASWRVGIDKQRATELVQTGLFSYSRNPIFLSMRFALLGLLLVQADAFALALLVAGELLIQVQTRLEEAHLLHLHGDAYQQYLRRVLRWV